MSVVLHVSDPHFGTERAAVVEALVAMARQQRPDLLVLTGDITQRARTAQFDAARAFARRLGAPVLAVPGNHDIPLFDLYSRMFRPYAGYAAAFGPELEPVHASDDLLAVAVNTTRPHRHKDGEVSPTQVERVARLLERAGASQLRLVVLHQPIEVMRPEDARDRLHGHALAQQRWAAAGADIVLGGHIHLPYLMALPGLQRPMWAVQAGTAVSSRVRAGVPNSVNLLRWGRDATPSRACLVERWDHDAAADAFVRAASIPVTPDRTFRA